MGGHDLRPVMPGSFHVPAAAVNAFTSPRKGDRTPLLTTPAPSAPVMFDPFAEDDLDQERPLYPVVEQVFVEAQWRLPEPPRLVDVPPPQRSVQQAVKAPLTSEQLEALMETFRHAAKGHAHHRMLQLLSDNEPLARYMHGEGGCFHAIAAHYRSGDTALGKRQWRAEAPAGCKEVVEKLVALRGAETLGRKDATGQTPAHLARDEELIRVMLGQGVNPMEERKEDKATPMTLWIKEALQHSSSLNLKNIRELGTLVGVDWSKWKSTACFDSVNDLASCIGSSLLTPTESLKIMLQWKDPDERTRGQMVLFMQMFKQRLEMRAIGSVWKKLDVEGKKTTARLMKEAGLETPFIRAKKSAPKKQSGGGGKPSTSHKKRPAR